MRRVLLALLASAAWTVASAQDFSPVCIDARTTAMGNAGVATTGSAYPTFNNAAAPLFEYQSIQASFSYSLFSGDELGKYRLMGAGAYVRLHERHAGPRRPHKARNILLLTRDEQDYYDYPGSSPCNGKLCHSPRNRAQASQSHSRLRLPVSSTPAGVSACKPAHALPGQPP